MLESIGSERTQSENDWYILRALVMSSVLLEGLLFFVAPLRKRTCSKWVLCLITVAFSLSTWLPSFTLVLILGRAIAIKDDEVSSSSYIPPLLTWASFLLIHRAGHGQERRTACSLHTGDHGKELCRVLLEFVFYDVIVFGSICLCQWTKEKLYIALPFVIVAYVRTFSKVKHELWDRSKEMEELGTLIAHFPPMASVDQADDTEITRFARDLLRISHRLLWGYGLTYEERDASRSFFLGIPPKEAIRILEVELNLFYYRFYDSVLHCSSEFVVVIFLLYATNNVYIFDSNLPFACPYDLIISTSFFFGGTALTVLVNSWGRGMWVLFAAMFVIWSHKKYVMFFLCNFKYEMTLSRYPQYHFGSHMLYILADRFIFDIASCILVLQLVVRKALVQPLIHNDQQPRKQRQSRYRSLLCYTYLHYWPRKAYYRMDRYLFRYTRHLGDWLRHHRAVEPQSCRWCGTIPRFSMLVYSLRKPRQQVPAFLNYLLNIRSVSCRDRYTDEIGEFLFKEIAAFRDRGLNQAALEIVSAKGQWVLQQNGYQSVVDQHEAPFEEIVLRWHLATGILYHTSSPSVGTSSNVRGMSMMLSDYMGYLLLIQPWIMSEHRGDAFRTSVAALSEIRKLIQSSQNQVFHDQTEEMKLKEICLRSLKDSSEEQDRNRLSLIHDACDLAEKIKSTIPDTDRMWEIISKVWVEMLAYVAINSDPMNHIRGLSQGGELASIVWLLMAHLGFVDNFNDSPRSHQETEPDELVEVPAPSPLTRYVRNKTKVFLYGPGRRTGGASVSRKRHTSSSSSSNS